MVLSLGIDIGTSSIKAIVIDAESLEVLAKNKVDHYNSSTIQNTEPDFHEQDPAAILRSVNRCVEGISKDYLKDVSVISVSGQMHGIVLWSKFKQQISGIQPSSVEKQSDKDTDTSNLITWQDGRCDKDFLNSLPDSSPPLATGFGCATLFWMQRNCPKMLQGYDSAGSIMDYLIYLKCGLGHSVMSPQIAHSWGYFSMNGNAWQIPVLERNSFPVRLLPEILEIGQIAGCLKNDWHGIPNGTAVNVACGDFQCSMLANCKDESFAVLNIGTSAQLAAICPPLCDTNKIQSSYPAVQIVPYFKNHKVVVAASLNGGNAIESFISMLKSWLTSLGIEVPETNLFYTKFDEFCGDKELDGTDLQIKPLLLGERHCPDLKASVTHISKQTLPLPVVVKELYRSIIQNIFSMMPKECLKVLGVESIVATGNFLVKNEYPRKIVEEVTQMPCLVFNETDAAFGAALSSL